MKPPPSFNGTENLIQNFCVKFSHNFDHKYSRIKNHFVIKGAPVTKENALKIAEILFQGKRFTDIIIESVDNDENTLTPSEYHFIQGVLKDRLSARKAESERRMEENPENAKKWDEDKSQKEYDEYLLMLIKKMEARMHQFPPYHT